MPGWRAGTGSAIPKYCRNLPSAFPISGGGTKIKPEPLAAIRGRGAAQTGPRGHTNKKETDMAHGVMVIGAGIVGISTAIHLLRRGQSVVLVDKNRPGLETSFGNAGIIQREGVRPHAFPRDLATLMQVG